MGLKLHRRVSRMYRSVVFGINVIIRKHPSPHNTYVSWYMPIIIKGHIDAFCYFLHTEIKLIN